MSSTFLLRLCAGAMSWSWTISPVTKSLVLKKRSSGPRFCPRQRLDNLNKLATEQKADDVFLSLVAKFEREGRDVSPNPSNSFAPSVFSKHQDGRGLTSDTLRASMDRLRKAGKPALAAGPQTACESRRGDPR